MPQGRAEQLERWRVLYEPSPPGGREAGLGTGEISKGGWAGAPSLELGRCLRTSRGVSQGVAACLGKFVHLSVKQTVRDSGWAVQGEPPSPLEGQGRCCRKVGRAVGRCLCKEERVWLLRGTSPRLHPCGALSAEASGGGAGGVGEAEPTVGGPRWREDSAQPAWFGSRSGFRKEAPPSSRANLLHQHSSCLGVFPGKVITTYQGRGRPHL